MKRDLLWSRFSGVRQQNILGFTLAEILVVICILSAMSFFLVNNYLKKTRDTLLEQATAAVIDVKRAALSHFVHYGIWPDAENSCENAAQQLLPFMGPIAVNPWGFAIELSCPSITVARADLITAPAEPVLVQPSLIIRQQVPNADIGQRLARRLPSAIVDSVDGQILVSAYVPMALLPGILDMSNQLIQRGNTVLFRAMHCPSGQTTQVILTPREICSTANGFYGYRLDYVPATSTTNERNLYEIAFEVLDGNDQWVNGFEACAVSTPLRAINVFQYCAGHSVRDNQ